MSAQQAGSGHVPVLLAEVLHWLRPRPGGVYLDATFGGGGYAEAILGAASCTLWAIDRDPDAIARGAALAARFPGRLHLVEGRFGSMLELLASHGVTALDGVAMDLGVSSFQIDQAERGFSFRADGPLDMRMDKGAPGTQSAGSLVASLSESELTRILHEYGEERFARRAARAIVAARADAPITTTGELARILRQAVPRSPDGIDSATRGFQALRIAVNNELAELQTGLDAASRLLAPGGRLVVVSFHSLEDRIVKRFMADRSGRAPRASRHDPASLLQANGQAAEFRLLTAKPVGPGRDETLANPRARSSRLRALERPEAA